MCNYLLQIAEKVIGVESKFDCRRWFLTKKLGVLFRLTVGAGVTALARFPSTTFSFRIEVDADVGVGTNGSRFGWGRRT